MSRRRLAGNALVSIFQVVLSAGILFALYSFLMRQLSVEQIGIWSLVLASTAIGRLTDMGLGGGVVKFVASDIGRSEPKMAARTIGMTITVMALLVGLACIALYLPLSAVLAWLVPGEESLQTARNLLPYALWSLWIATLANVFLSALDGYQRMDLRAGITIGAAAGQLVAAYMIVPRYGLTGVGITQVVQTFLLFVSAAFLVLRYLRQPWRVWLGWDRRRFRELFLYGGGFQVAAIGQLLFEPTVKALLAIFGGLALTGYYEMANRMITQFRAVVVTAYQALVPYVASSAHKKPELRALYLAAHRLLIFIAIPYYAFLGVSLPALLTTWRGWFEPDFLLVSVSCLVAWAFNTMAAPAYLVYLGIGRMRWVMWTHVSIGLLNIVIASVAGWIWGGLGVLFGAASALAVGSFVVIFAFHHEYGIPLRALLPRESVGLAVICIGGLVVVTALALRGGPYWTVTILSGPLIFAAIVAVLGWHNPNRPILVDLLRQATLFNAGRIS